MVGLTYELKSVYAAHSEVPFASNEGCLIAEDRLAFTV